MSNIQFLLSEAELEKALFLPIDEINKHIIDETMTEHWINGQRFFDSREINEKIKKSKKNYDFVKVNVNNPPNEQQRTIQQNNFNVIDLFCGAGGSSTGFKLAGFNLIGALDFNEKAAATHKLNFPQCHTVVNDITQLSPSEFNDIIGNQTVDVLIGSPPCQTFSSLSQGKIKSLGKDIKKDIRNYYYKNYLDYLSFFKPKMFLMENVPGFQTKFEGMIFNDFLDYLSEHLPEYTITYKVLDAVNYGVPQNRKRLFVCGYLDGYHFEFPESNTELLEEKEDFVSVENALLDLPDITDDWRLDHLPYSKYENLTKYQRFIRGNSTWVRNNICRVSNNEAKQMFNYLKPGQKYMELDDTTKEKISLFDTFSSSVIQTRCRRLPLAEASWTVIAHIGMDGYEYIHPTECRTLSVREAARLQSFPDDFVFVGNMREQYVQIGNAVPPLLSYALAKEIENALTNPTPKPLHKREIQEKLDLVF
ncbi:DNA (cytosine-5)-methyltransferase 1 [Ureibacillus xyleni]|uniref:Cytosine-specific methyltransferase n=1 Tax=Ureibacillus xyleni TaxID=614648 RepID=A0A285SU43_9BACL|nr:DNA cytosine methyltransferase [Ureibacillus xyleni]SOC11356.1 DNA (cytosine-5)-methyltransferase 1 [Ureibacillus xyleni]